MNSLQVKKEFTLFKLFNYFSFLFLMFTLFTPPIFSQSKVKDSQKHAFKTYNDSNNGNVKIKWNHKIGSPFHIKGNNSKAYSGNLESAAKKYLNEIMGLLNINPSSDKLKYEKTISSNGTNSILFKQFYKKLEVYTGKYVVILNDDNQVISSNGSFYPDIKISTMPQISDLNAIEISKSALKVNTVSQNDFTTELIIYPLDEMYKLAWKVKFNDNSNYNYLLIIDANTSKIIYSTSLTSGVDGTANVFLTDPRGNTTHQPISNLIGNGYLDGDYVSVYNINTTFPRAYNRYHRFIFDTSEVEFNQANVYYHINRICKAYFEETLNHDFEFSINAFVNLIGTGAIMNRVNNAVYEISLTNGYSDPNVYPKKDDSARKDDIIYHETAHAFIYDKGLEYDQLESQSMHEGYADYFAATFTNNSEIGEWYYLDYPYFLRQIENDKNYFNDINYGNITYHTDDGVYKNSLIWSGALWDLRNAIPTIIADKIIFEGISNSPGNQTFEQGLQGILDADNFYYAGQHLNTIISKFYDRGIGRPKPPSNLTLTGSVGQNPTLTWNASQERDLNHYDLFISYDGGSIFTHLIQLAETVTSYTDPGVTIGGQLDPFIFYKVSATDDFDNESDKSLAVKVHAHGINKESELEELSGIPKEFKLYEAYPNPFNPVTTIKFALPYEANVSIVIYDILGNKVADLTNKQLGPGTHNVKFDASRFSSGVYIYNIAIKNNTNAINISKKLLLQK